MQNGNNIVVDQINIQPPTNKMRRGVNFQHYQNFASEVNQDLSFSAILDWFWADHRHF